MKPNSSIHWIMPGIMPNSIPGFFEQKNDSIEKVKLKDESEKDTSTLPVKYQVMSKFS